MMTPADHAYLKMLLGNRLISGSVLEIGSREVPGSETNTRTAITDAGLKWEGADIERGTGVDWVVDLLDDETIASTAQRWSTVLLFNILEHLYDPPTAMRNAVRLVEPGGRLAVITPAIWQLHDYPADYWRPMPDFYIEFARREGLQVVEDAFCWLLEGRILPVGDLHIGEQKVLPARYPLGESIFGRVPLLYSRTVNRALRTVGRFLVYPWSALGVVLEVAPSS
jgi:SAM-dependent methyltransferase